MIFQTCAIGYRRGLVEMVFVATGPHLAPPPHSVARFLLSISFHFYAICRGFHWQTCLWTVHLDRSWNDSMREFCMYWLWWIVENYFWKMVSADVNVALHFQSCSNRQWFCFADIFSAHFRLPFIVTAPHFGPTSFSVLCELQQHCFYSSEVSEPVR